MNKPRELLAMAQEVDRLLGAVRQTLRQPVETEFARGGLTGPQRSLMQVLVHSDGMSLKELSRQMGLAHSTVSGIVDRLEKQGLVERRLDQSDRRLSRIAPSKVVRDFVREALPALMIHPLLEALRRAKPAERATIVEGLRTLHRVVAGD